jgi:hypothetical protein
MLENRSRRVIGSTAGMVVMTAQPLLLALALVVFTAWVSVAIRDHGPLRIGRPLQGGGRGRAVSDGSRRLLGRGENEQVGQQHADGLAGWGTVIAGRVGWPLKKVASAKALVPIVAWASTSPALSDSGRISRSCSNSST